MNTNKVMFGVLAVALAVALVFAIAPALVTSASARIACTNGGGQEVQGNCQGPHEYTNPAGKAPKGQN